MPGDFEVACEFAFFFGKVYFALIWLLYEGYFITITFDNFSSFSISTILKIEKDIFLNQFFQKETVQITHIVHVEK